MNFDCQRSCPLVGAAWCRFRPILDTLGRVRVSSHTVKVRVEYTDPDVLRAAVLKLGGLWYGQGHYDLGDTQQDGHGFRLPMARGLHHKDGKDYWYHPLVSLPSGELAYDAFGGAWGDLAGLDRLKAEYAQQKIEAAAQTLGWLTERTADALLVHHPQGGVLTYKDGVCDATGFVGTGCHTAEIELMQQAGLEVVEAQAKPEYGQVQARVELPTP